MDQMGCLGCDIAHGRVDVPGGLLYASERWIANHCVGALNTGTLVASPREHICRVADLDDPSTTEVAYLLRGLARALEELCEPEQVYVCLWSHGPSARRHLHYVIQPVTAALVRQFNGARSEALQAQMMSAGIMPTAGEMSAFCQAARPIIAKHTG